MREGIIRSDIGDDDLPAVLPDDVAEHWLARLDALDCTIWGELQATISPEILDGRRRLPHQQPDESNNGGLPNPGHPRASNEPRAVHCGHRCRADHLGATG